jgi:hypothetical protein
MYYVAHVHMSYVYDIYNTHIRLYTLNSAAKSHPPRTVIARGGSARLVLL